MKRNGFTLIELMIVMAIIGILSALVLPAFTKHKNHGVQSGQDDNSQGVQSQPLDPSATVAHPKPAPEVQCIEHYKFLDGKQILDISGHGIPCV